MTVVDLRGVDITGGGRSAHLPEDGGPYKFQVRKATEKVGNDSGKPYLQVESEVAEGKFKGKKLYHVCSLQPKALFTLKQLMVACGIQNLEKRLDSKVIAKSLTNKSFRAHVEDDEYEGKVKSVIASFIIDTEDEEDDDEEEEEEPKPARKARAKAKKAPVEEEDDDEEELDDLDLDDL